MRIKVPKRKYTLGIRLKEYERRYIESEASVRGKRVSDYVRDILLATMSDNFSVGKNNA